MHLCLENQHLFYNMNEDVFDEFKTKVECFRKKNGWLEKKMKNHQSSHLKKTMNLIQKTEIPGGGKPKRKLYEKETANIQLKKKQTSAPQALLHQHHSKAHLPRH